MELWDNCEKIVNKKKLDNTNCNINSRFQKSAWIVRYKVSFEIQTLNLREELQNVRKKGEFLRYKLTNVRSSQNCKIQTWCKFWDKNSRFQRRSELWEVKSVLKYKLTICEEKVQNVQKKAEFIGYKLSNAREKSELW